MTFRSQRSLALLLATTFAGSVLTGCNALPSSTLVDAPASNATRTASVAKTGPQLARDFAAELKQKGVEATVSGAVVTTKDADGDVLRYDFTKTAQSGTVVFTAGGTSTELRYGTSENGDRVIPWKLVWIAARMVYGGAKAWYWYSHTHQGADYSREDLVKAILYGMLQGGLAGLPVGFLWSKLAPIVWKWITGEDPIAPSVRQIFEQMKGDIDNVASILAEGERLKQQGQLQ